MEQLVSLLSYSRLRFVSQLFSGTPRRLLEADPATQERIIADCERRVYGPAGIAVYEQNEPVRLKRLVRRSLAQYLSQREQMAEWWLRELRRAMFTAALPALLGYLLVKTLRMQRAAGLSIAPADTVVFYWAERLSKFVWEGMFGERSFVLHRRQEVHLGADELRFVARAVRECPRLLRYPEFLCNLLRWVAYYGFVVRHYRPRRVAHFFESVASSSLMTAYLSERHIEHCDIQHGEIVFSAFSAFAEFDEFRLWGEHFRDLLIRQRSPGDHMQVVRTPFHRDLFHRVRPSSQPRPLRLLIIDPFLHAIEWDHDADFRRLLRELDGRWEVCIRRHPADRTPALPWMASWNADAELRRRDVRVKEERPESVPLDEALRRSRVVAGVSSTALLEAWIAGCKVVYVPGGPSRAATMERHGGSSNVCHLEDDVDLARFVRTPACLDEAESRRVHYLTAVLDEESGGSARG